MISSKKAAYALLGIVLFILGLAVSGMLSHPSKQSPPPQFEAARGQMGYLLQSVQHRDVGLAMMAIGAFLLVYSTLKKKWH